MSSTIIRTALRRCVTNHMDKDGYPTPEELDSITWWRSGYGPTGNPSFRDLMEYIEERWKWADAGYWTWTKGADPASSDSTKKSIAFRISTGGWSGNEDIIQAMESNIVFWATCWVSSRRGGHYEFEVKL